MDSSFSTELLWEIDFLKGEIVKHIKKIQEIEDREKVFRDLLRRIAAIDNSQTNPNWVSATECRDWARQTLQKVGYRWEVFSD